MQLRSGAAALLVLASLMSTTTVSTAVPAANGTSTRTVHREYGQGPVRMGHVTTLKVSFAGQRGDRVRLGKVGRCPVSLRGPDGERLAPRPEGFWRLQDAGRQTFTLTRCDDLDNDSQVQLEKLRLAHVGTNASGTRLPAKRGYVDAVRVVVPATGRLQLTADDVAQIGRWYEGMVLPNGDWYRLTGLAHHYVYYFEDGQPIATPFGRLRGAGGGGALVMHAGDRVTLVAAGAMTVWTSVALPVSVVVDGPATMLEGGSVPYRQFQVEFDATAGDWLHAEVLDPVGPWATVLLGPNGHQFGGASYWHIPATGRYRLMLPTGATPSTSVVRIRTITQLPSPMPTDGTPVTFTAVEPGEWVMAPLTLASSTFYRLNAGTASTTGEWTAVATGQSVLQCPRMSNGCGDWSYGSVSPTSATSTTFGLNSGLPNPWLVMLQMGAGETGSVAVSVTVSPTLS